MVFIIQNIEKVNIKNLNKLVVQGINLQKRISLIQMLVKLHVKKKYVLKMNNMMMTMMMINIQIVVMMKKWYWIMMMMTMMIMIVVM